jgi:hypothetical protein
MTEKYELIGPTEDEFRKIIEREYQMLRRMFKKGNKGALLWAIYETVLVNKKVVPKWIVDAFREAYSLGRAGEIRSWDEVFGSPPARYGAARRLTTKFEQQRLVFEEVRRLKAEGKPLNEEEFVGIGKRLGIGSKSKVKALLREARAWNERMERTERLFRRH